MAESLHIELRNTGKYFFSVAVKDGVESKPEAFNFRQNGSRVREALKRIEENRCKSSDINDAGAELFGALFCGETKAAYDRLREGASVENHVTLRLLIPHELAGLPWEALCDTEAATKLLILGDNMTLAREIVMSNRAPAAIPPTDALSILVLIPEGSGLNVSYEYQNVERIVNEHEGIATVDYLAAPVSPERIRAKLKERRWDVVHFIGHGEVSLDEKSFSVNLNNDDGQGLSVDGDRFASLFGQNPPRLVVLNCCNGAVPSARRSLSGAGPALLRYGVMAVVAMRYEIFDEDAIRFASAFYQSLLNPKSSHLGEVDRAVGAGRGYLYRNSLSDNQRSYITPVLFLHRNYSRLLAPTTTVPSPLVPSAPPPEQPDSQTLTECLRSVKQRNCVLVLGPGVMTANQSRNAPAYPPVRALARQLATDCGFRLPGNPELDEFSIAILLPWVCQQYQQKHTRPRLLQTLAGFYANCVPSPVLSTLGRLNPPAIVYTHFDGLMESALRHIAVRFTVTSSMADTNGLDLSAILLLCPTGGLPSHKNLVLTEEEHERLHGQIGSLSSVVIDHLGSAVGRSTLFAGVSPRDPVARRMAGRFLEAGTEQDRSQGPTYFVCSDHSPADDAYWDKYGVQWIEESMDHVCASILREGA